METLGLFMAYAKDFEKTFKDDDWSRLEKYFAADAVYEVVNSSFDCHLEGRPAIFAGIRKSIDGFDRRVDSRRIEVLSPPRVDKENFEVAWAVTYNHADLPALRVAATTIARFRDGEIVHLADRYDETSGRIAKEWIAEAARQGVTGLDFSYV